MGVKASVSGIYNVQRQNIGFFRWLSCFCGDPFDWHLARELTVDCAKTQALSVGPCAYHYSLFLNNAQIEFLRCIKILGVTLDKDLSYKGLPFWQMVFLAKFPGKTFCVFYSLVLISSSLYTHLETLHLVVADGPLVKGRIPSGHMGQCHRCQEFYAEWH